jgi:addiction module RelE/StbE family toxin
MKDSLPLYTSLTCSENLSKIRDDVKIGKYVEYQTIKELIPIFEGGDCSYEVILSEDAQKEIKKLAHKDKPHFKQFLKKLEHVLEDPYHFKPLLGPLFGIRRVHIGSYVLTYEIEEDKKKIVLLHYLHHKNVYR